MGIHKLRGVTTVTLLRLKLDLLHNHITSKWNVSQTILLSKAAVGFEPNLFVAVKIKSETKRIGIPSL